MLIFDIETDGFYEAVSKVHCIVIKDTETGRVKVANPVTGFDGALLMLEQADTICGHNVLKYDLPVLRKLFPGWDTKAKVLDTLIVSRLLFPDTSDNDSKLVVAGKLPGKHHGAHKLEAWGYRLGVLKGEFDGPWEEWTQEMEDYCVQDVVVTEVLLNMLQKRKWPETAVELEHDVARIISRQEINGFGFDEAAALELLRKLSVRRAELEDELKATFGWWWKGGKIFTPKADNRKHGYTKGAPLTKVTQVHFNPSSRQHIAKVLTERFGWKPTSFTPEGYPEVSEESLAAIRHPEAKTLIDYLTVQKRLGALADGRHAWFKYVRNGRIHGSVNTLGAVTSRMTHSNPNIAQVPAGRSPYGHECRALFRPTRPGWVQVGADASSLELRVLAGYMAPYDGGAYVKVVVEGRKDNGTEIHSVNMRALEITDRDDAKTWFYAFIYGAGDEKLGLIVSKVNQKAKNRKRGKALRQRFLTNLPAMGKLINRIKAKAKERKWLKGIDGRPLFCRSPHSAPNTLFQAAGAILMKRALVLLDTELQTTLNLKPGVDYEFLANVHDEWQIECRPELAAEVGRVAVESIREAGRRLALKCPLDGEFKVGRTWADTH